MTHPPAEPGDYAIECRPTSRPRGAGVEGMPFGRQGEPVLSLSQQTIGILIRPTLPRTLRIAEVNVDVVNRR
jgi:hypothetical protein